MSGHSLDAKIATKKPWAYNSNVKSIKTAFEKMDIGSHENFAIGIDLGTKNLCVAVYINQKVHIIANSLHRNTTPSYISFGENNAETIGEVAKKEAYKNPRNTIYDSKRMIGRSMDDENLLEAKKRWQFCVEATTNNVPRIRANSEFYKPEEISAKLLKHCVEMAEAFLQKKVSGAVITVPAYFNDNQKKATEKAGRIAGINVIGLLNEPTAAAIAYKIERIHKDTNRVLIFDLGGGTFDVAIVDLVDGDITVIGLGGDAFLGGDDFDNVLVDYCAEEFKKKHRKDIRDKHLNSRSERSMALLREECEKKKIYLTSTDQVTIDLPNAIGEIDLEVKVTRQKYEELAMPLVNRMINIVDATLKDCSMPKIQINDIILVGASTRTPILQQKLKEYFNVDTLNSTINPDDAVAYGAAVYSAYKSFDDETRKVFDIKRIDDVVPMSIGIKAAVENRRDVFDKIIHKNTKYPSERVMSYTTYSDNQTDVDIWVYQGENPVASKNYLLGNFRLSGIPSKRAGEEKISVSMKLDYNGILRIDATCISTRGTKHLEVKNMHDIWSQNNE